MAPAAMADGDLAALFDGGDGTADSPYQIGSAGSFQNLNQVPDGTVAYFALARDIDFRHLLVASPDLPVDDAGRVVTTPITNFQGHLDGGGYTLSGIAINSRGDYPPSNSTHPTGIFNRMEDGSVANLTVRDCAVAGDDLGWTVGVLAGYMDGMEVASVTVDSCVLELTTPDGSASEYGVLAGYLNDCVVSGVTVSNASLTATIPSLGTPMGSGWVGLLTGRADGGQIGLDGAIAVDGALNVTVKRGESAYINIGAAIGYVGDAEVANLTVGGNAAASVSVLVQNLYTYCAVGGLAGYLEGGSIAASSTTADVTLETTYSVQGPLESAMPNSMGGFVGMVMGGGITGSRASGSLVGLGAVSWFGVGGFVGGLAKGDIAGCTYAGSWISLGHEDGSGVDEYESTAAVGGFAGMAGALSKNNQASITNCSVKAPGGKLAPTGKDDSLVIGDWNQPGDFGLWIDAWPEKATLYSRQDKNIGTFAYGAGTGGFAGWVGGAVLDNCLVQSVYIEAADLAGGFVGHYQNDTAPTGSNQDARTRVWNASVDTAYINSHGGYNGGFAGMAQGAVDGPAWNGAGYDFYGQWDSSGLADFYNCRALNITNLNIADQLYAPDKNGGFAGYMIQAYAHTCFVKANLGLEGNPAGHNQGGFAGEMRQTLLFRCLAGGSLYSSGAISGAGGLVGNMVTPDSTTQGPWIYESAAYFNITSGGAADWVGGLVGDAQTGIAQNVYAIGAIAPTNPDADGSLAVGGLFGEMGESFTASVGYAAVAVNIVSDRDVARDFFNAFKSAVETGFDIAEAAESFSVKNVLDAAKSAKETIENVVDVVMDFKSSSRGHKIGGLVGDHDDASAQPINMYWDTETSGQEDYLWSTLDFPNHKYGLSTDDIVSGDGMTLDWSVWTTNDPYTRLAWELNNVPGAPTGSGQ